MGEPSFAERTVRVLEQAERTPSNSEARALAEIAKGYGMLVLAGQIKELSLSMDQLANNIMRQQFN